MVFSQSPSWPDSRMSLSARNLRQHLAHAQGIEYPADDLVGSLANFAGLLKIHPVGDRIRSGRDATARFRHDVFDLVDDELPETEACRRIRGACCGSRGKQASANCERGENFGEPRHRSDKELGTILGCQLGWQIIEVLVVIVETLGIVASPRAVEVDP